MSSKLTTVLLCVAAAALVGGGAYAIGAASSAKKISACAKKKGGDLRLATRCTKSERKVSWNVQGPPGPAGAAGAAGTPGTKGDKGDTGSSGTANLGEAMTTYDNAISTIGVGHTDKSRISTAPLPAGAYAIQAAVNWTAHVASSGPASIARAVCKLSISTGDSLGFDQRQIGTEAGATGGTVATTDFQSAAFVLTADVPEGASAQLVCDADGDATAPITLVSRFITTERLKSQTQAGANPVDFN